MEGSNVVQIERVRCLECGAKYVRTADCGTACCNPVRCNPGCPRCGYAGWILATIPASASAGPVVRARARSR